MKWIPALFLYAAFALSAQNLPLMPWPANIHAAAGLSDINASFSVSLSGAGSSDPRVKAAALRTLSRLARQTGMPIPVRIAPDNGTLHVVVERRDHAGPQRLGDDESYSLRISNGLIVLAADGPLGAIRGFETFLQLIAQNHAPAPGQPAVPGFSSPGFSIPNLEIQDQPRFPWRGLSLDVSRHFIPVDGIERTIDGLAAVKLNVLHWHLSDDQGFRVESRRYPRLQQYGSDGLYYTQAQIREVVAYARDRGVRVVPEFDIPGHSTSWLPGYPSLGSGPGPYNIVHEFGDPSGVFDPTKEATYRFLEGFIGEMVKLFPDEYFHIGGDEVSAKAWTGEPHIRAYMKAHHIAHAAELQALFNKRVEKILAHYHKRMEGWDEILQPGLPKTILIQSWRGEKSLAAAAREGYPGILSAGYYLDLMQPASQHYAVDPLHGEAADLTPEQKKLILGGEAAMWEELATAENLDSRLWPRLAAIAERLWSPESVSDPANMYERLAEVNRWLEWLGLSQRANLDLMLRRLVSPDNGAFDGNLDALRAFASAFEPVKGYERHRNHYGAISSFNRLVDGIPPESDAAREFRDAVDRYLSDKTPAGADALKKQLARWSQTAADIRQLLESNSLLNEDLPLADALTALCKAGDEALTYSTGGAPEGWKQNTAATLKDANAHHASLSIAIGSAIQKLVDAVP